MQFNSYSYLILLIPVLFVFWQLRPAWRHTYLLAISVLFYATWSVLYTPLPLIICAAVFWFGLLMTRRPEHADLWLKLGISVVLLCLAFFKYSRFLNDNLNGLWTFLTGHPIGSLTAIALPLGISFYSFEAISYLFDARQRRLERVRLRDLYLFIMFWPHLIAGPIVRVRELLPQLRLDRKFEPRFVVSGVERILWGLVQKNVIVNSLSPWVEEGFQPRVAALNSTLDTWFLAIAFGLQIYFDFSAYSNLAIGTAQLFGITLPENFRFPYHAATPSEFWSRWHMTLSRWVRDYVFFPITTKFNAAPLAFYGSLLGIMALVGLWHGAGWGFVLWGVMQGAYLMAYRVWEGFAADKQFRPAVARIVRWTWRVLTLTGVAAAWVPFRASSGQQTLTLLRLMFLNLRLGLSYSVNFYLITMAILALCALEPLLASWLAISEDDLESVRPIRWYVLKPALYAAALLLFMIFDDQDTRFIYFQF